LHRQAAIAECKHSYLHAARLLLHKGARGDFGRLHSIRLQILGRHAAGNIKCQNDRPFDPRDADDRLWSCQRDDQNRQAGQKQRRRNVAAYAELAPCRRLHQPQATVARSQPPPPPQQAHIQHGAQRDQQQHNQHHGPDE
jgi:hypothetical protein